MSFMDRIAAKRDAFRQQKQELLAKQQPKVDKPRYKVRNGKIILRMRAQLAKRKPASNVVKLLPRETGEHVVGGTCPHCNGTGRYKSHLYGTEDDCWRCHTKGILNGRDMHYYRQRLEGKRGPLCHVVSA